MNWFGDHSFAISLSLISRQSWHALLDRIILSQIVQLKLSHCFCAKTMPVRLCTRPHCQEMTRYSWQHFCCNACRKGERWHTRNCLGASKPIELGSSPQDQQPSAQHQQPSSTEEPLRRPTAKRMPQPRTPGHTPQTQAMIAFRLPFTWQIGCTIDEPVTVTKFLAHLDWYMQHFNLRMERGAFEKWRSLAYTCANVSRGCWRPVRLRMYLGWCAADFKFQIFSYYLIGTIKNH